MNVVDHPGTTNAALSGDAIASLRPLLGTVLMPGTPVAKPAVRGTAPLTDTRPSSSAVVCLTSSKPLRCQHPLPLSIRAADTR
jgi:hypothetical protein